MPKGKRISYVGMRSGKLLVIAEKKAPKNSTSYHKIVICKCDCGRIFQTRGTSIANKRVQSCGCAAIEKHIKRLTKHGMFGTRIYRIWCGIKRRCYGKEESSYRRYGGRGITMCDEWKNDFMSFYNWAIANGYKDNLTIDRINNDGNYEPSNCRWTTNKEQSRNTSTNRLLYYKGEVRCVVSWAEKLGINYHTLLSRLRKGMSVEKALEYKKKFDVKE